VNYGAAIERGNAENGKKCMFTRADLGSSFGDSVVNKGRIDGR
jgi:hypothetical protein